MNSLNTNINKNMNLLNIDLPDQYRKSLNPDKSILDTRNKMLFILKQKNEYKKKIIYSQFSIILLIILLIVSIIYSSK